MKVCPPNGCKPTNFLPKVACVGAWAFHTWANLQGTVLMSEPSSNCALTGRVPRDMVSSFIPWRAGSTSRWGRTSPSLPPTSCLILAFPAFPLLLFLLRGTLFWLVPCITTNFSLSLLSFSSCFLSTSILFTSFFFSISIFLTSFFFSISIF